METMTKKQIREEELERAIEDIRIARAAKKSIASSSQVKE